MPQRLRLNPKSQNNSKCEVANAPTRDKKQNIRYHEIRPRFASLAGSVLGKDEEFEFQWEASPHRLFGVCFVLGQISLRTNKQKAFLPLKTSKQITHTKSAPKINQIHLPTNFNFNLTKF